MPNENVSGATLHNTMLECGRQGLLLNITSVPSLYTLGLEMFSDFIDYIECNGLPQFNLLRKSRNHGFE